MALKELKKEMRHCAVSPLIFLWREYLSYKVFRVSSNLVGINFQYSLYIPFFASWKTITYKCWHV